MTKEPLQKTTVGILAYGSLISNPGAEIKKARTNIINDVITPFHIEFARSSSGRGGAPTLVPVTSGGSHVKGQVFVMDVSEAKAADILYRREIDEVGNMTRSYTRPDPVTDKKVLVERLSNFAGLDVVLYTQIAATITPLTAEHLAKLAIASVAEADPDLDGISYLIAAKKHGIETALSPAYEAEILKETKSKSLDEALEKLLAKATK
ncbi:MAG: gamma-glutamylcyclotransferase [Pararhodobacter sp.]|nr:gamma-glutamylcyclotransferase [Pararhodobacter sp.]